MNEYAFPMICILAMALGCSWAVCRRVFARKRTIEREVADLADHLGVSQEDPLVRLAVESGQPQVIFMEMTVALACWMLVGILYRLG